MFGRLALYAAGVLCAGHNWCSMRRVAAVLLPALNKRLLPAQAGAIAALLAVAAAALMPSTPAARLASSPMLPLYCAFAGVQLLSAALLRVRHNSLRRQTRTRQ